MSKSIVGPTHDVFNILLNVIIKIHKELKMIKNLKSLSFYEKKYVYKKRFLTCFLLIFQNFRNSNNFFLKAFFPY